jgi:hypothetical protein
MAVIREQRQFKIGTIGVARASEGGRIVGQQIAQSANQFANLFYQEGLQAAEKAGTEAAQSVERERIMTINPQTGQPEAYSPPAPFGRAAADAYQRVVQRRFQESMDEEMRIKSAELAARYEDNPNGVALYETAMSDYIAAMSESAEGQFGGYISEVGASYLNLTRSNLAINQMRRERSQAREAQAAAAQSANNQLRMLVSQYGPEALNGPTLANSIANSSNVVVEDSVQSGLFDPSAINVNNRDQALSVAYGYIEYASRNINDPETLELLQHAIGTQDPNAVPAGYEYIADAMRGFGSDYEALSDMESMADGLLADRREYVGVLRQREIDEMERQEAISIFNMNEGTAASVASASSMASDPAFQAGAVAQRALQAYQSATAEAQSYIASGRTDLSNSVIENRNSILNGYIEGLHLRAVSGLDRDQTEQLEAAIMASNPRLAPTEESRSALTALLSISRSTDYNVIEDMPPFIGSYRDGAARFVDSEQAATAYNNFRQNVERDIFDIRLQRGENIDSAIASSIVAVRGIENLDPNVAENAINEIQYRGGQALISQFLEGNPTETQIAAAANVLEGGDITDGLTQNQVNLLTAARDLGASSGKEANLRTHFNTVSGSVRELRRQEEARLEEFQSVDRIFNQGAGDPTSVSDRRLVEERFQSSFATQLQAAGYQSLGQMFADPAALQNEEVRPILEAVNRMNVMPESLHNLFVSLSNGSFVGNSPTTLISHYTNYRDYTYGGIVMDNPMMSSLTEEQRTTLNFLADASPILGSDNQALADLYTSRSRMRNDPNFSDKAETFFGSSPYEFVRNLDGASNLSASALRGMEAAAVSLFALSSERGMSAEAVQDQLERQLERSYPDGGGIVFGPNMSPRTRAPLSYAAPNNENIMQDYVIRRLTEAGVTNPRLGLGGQGALAATGRAIGGAVMSAVGIDTNQSIGGGRYFLQPIGTPTRGFVQYQVVELLPAEQGGRRPVMETRTEEIEGEQVQVVAPLIISNQDPVYLNMVRENTRLRNQNALDRAERVGRVREQYAPAPEFEFGINP